MVPVIVSVRDFYTPRLPARAILKGYYHQTPVGQAANNKFFPKYAVVQHSCWCFSLLQDGGGVESVTW